MERIGGTIDIRSKEGFGTTFVIKIPLTLAIVSALIVESGGERFAIPQIGVVELVRVGGEGAAKLERIKDVPVLRLRDRLLPLVHLARLLELDGTASEESGFVVVTQVGAHVFGIIVDRVFDTEEIVVKPVAPILRHVTMFSGNTILGDGSVIMILDPNGIARANGLGTEGGDADQDKQARNAQVTQSDAKTALLLFRAGDVAPQKMVQVIAASAAGTVFEWYDFFIFAILSTIISKHFYAGLPDAQAFVFTLLTFAVGFIVRPLGALAFGKICSGIQSSIVFY
jgi:two-component system chemotaxis sensor kinase CheA